MPFLAIMTATLAHSWGSYIVMICLPQYMNDILHFDIASVSIIYLFPRTEFETKDMKVTAL